MQVVSADTPQNDWSGSALKILVPKETEVQTKDNRWYTMRIRPYSRCFLLSFSCGSKL